MRFLQILRQICYSLLLARHCVSFITAGKRNRYDNFLCLIRLSSIQNHSPAAHAACQDSVSKMNF